MFSLPVRHARTARASTLAHIAPMNAAAVAATVAAENTTRRQMTPLPTSINLQKFPHN